MLAFRDLELGQVRTNINMNIDTVDDINPALP